MRDSEQGTEQESYAYEADYGESSWQEETYSDSYFGEEPARDEPEPEPPDLYHAESSYPKQWISWNRSSSPTNSREHARNQNNIANSDSLGFTGYSKDPLYYIRWETTMERWLRVHNIPKEEKLGYALGTLGGDAYQWWLQEDARTHLTSPVRDWGDLKVRMYREFVKKLQQYSYTPGKSMYQTTTRRVVPTPNLQPNHKHHSAYFPEPKKVISKSLRMPTEPKRTAFVKDVQQRSTTSTLVKPKQKGDVAKFCPTKDVEPKTEPVQQNINCDPQENLRNPMDHIEVNSDNACDRFLLHLDKLIHMVKTMGEQEFVSSPKIKEDKTEICKTELNDSMTMITHFSSVKSVEKVSGIQEDITNQEEVSKTTMVFSDQILQREETTPMLNKAASKDVDSVHATTQFKEEPPDTKTIEQNQGSNHGERNYNEIKTYQPAPERYEVVTNFTTLQEEPPDYTKNPITVATKELETVLSKSSAQVSPLPQSVSNTVILDFLSPEEPKENLVSIETNKNQITSSKTSVNEKLDEVVKTDSCFSVLSNSMTVIMHLPLVKSEENISGMEKKEQEHNTQRLNEYITWEKGDFTKTNALQPKDVSQQPWRGVIASFLIKEEPPDPRIKLHPNSNDNIARGKLLNSNFYENANLLYLGAGKEVSRTKPFQGGGYDADIHPAIPPGDDPPTMKAHGIATAFGMGCTGCTAGLDPCPIGNSGSIPKVGTVAPKLLEQYYNETIRSDLTGEHTHGRAETEETISTRTSTHSAHSFNMGFNIHQQTIHFECNDRARNQLKQFHEEPTPESLTGAVIEPRKLSLEESTRAFSLYLCIHSKITYFQGLGRANLPKEPVNWKESNLKQFGRFILSEPTNSDRSSSSHALMFSNTHLKTACCFRMPKTASKPAPRIGPRRSHVPYTDLPYLDQGAFKSQRPYSLQPLRVLETFQGNQRLLITRPFLPKLTRYKISPSYQFHTDAPKLHCLPIWLRRVQRLSMENHIWKPGAVSSPIPQAEDTQRRAKELYSFSLSRFYPIGFSGKGFNEATPLVRNPGLGKNLRHLPQAQECLSLRRYSQKAQAHHTFQIWCYLHFLKSLAVSFRTTCCLCFFVLFFV